MARFLPWAENAGNGKNVCSSARRRRNASRACEQPAADLLIIDTTDLPPHLGSDLARMAADRVWAPSSPGRREGAGRRPGTGVDRRPRRRARRRQPAPAGARGQLISANRSDLQVATFAELAPTAGLVLREEQVLGRAGEEPGRLTSRLSVRIAGRLVPDQELACGPGAPGCWDGPA